MATIRVFLLTCRRPQLLPRALNSLLGQSLTDWVCELHNDAPEDDGPRKLLEEINDPRISLHQHDTSWGAVDSFRHIFAGGPEPFSSLLEDDNWWEPEFLETALKTLKENPNANLVWANLHIWRENADSSWESMQRPIWQGKHLSNARPVSFRSLQPIQCFNALHSNGATLFRSDVSRAAAIPQDTPFDIIEVIRERLIPGDLILLPKPLGYFAVTRQTARDKKRHLWLRSQLLCAASYIYTIKPNNDTLAKIWSTLRSHKPPSTSQLFHVALAGVQPWAILRHAQPLDWLRFLRGIVRHPLTTIRALRFRQECPQTWQALLSAPTRPGGADTLPPIYKKVLDRVDS